MVAKTSPKKYNRRQSRDYGFLSLDPEVNSSEVGKLDVPLLQKKPQDAFPSKLSPSQNITLQHTVTTGLFDGSKVEDDDFDDDEPSPTTASSNFWRNAVVACLACVMGATDGVSLGGLVFPSSEAIPNSEYKALGMSLGLLAMVVMNLGSLLGSGIAVSVGGCSMPPVIVLSAFFSTLGPTMCPTILFMVAVGTAVGGLVIWLAGYLRLASVVRACPFVVYGGFMAGTGVILLQCGLNMMYPRFESLLSPGSFEALLDSDRAALWLPGTCAGVVLFWINQSSMQIPGVPKELLVPVALVVLAACFYASVFITDRGVEEVRADGFLFDIEVPSQLVFYRVWTLQVAGFADVHWEYFLKPELWSALVTSSLIGVLTVVMNIFGTSRSIGQRINLDKEIMLHGVCNVGCGVLSGLPCNMVMSFSLSCKKLGADGRQFQVMAFLMSLITFLCGDFILAYLPKLLPGTVLIWLGFELSWYWVWDSRLFLSTTEYCLVWVMILLDVLVGAGYMMGFGLLVAMWIVIRQSSAVPILGLRRPLSELHSGVIRPAHDQEFLGRQGSRAEIWRVNSPYLYFASVRQIIDQLEELPAGGRVRYISLDFQEVLFLEVTATSALVEALQAADDKGCVLVVARPDAAVLAQMVLFGLPLVHLTQDAPIVAKAQKIIVAPTLHAALRWIEDSLIQDKILKRLDSTHADMSPSARTPIFCSAADPLIGLWCNIDLRLCGRCSIYEGEVFSDALRPALEVRVLQSGELLYDSAVPTHEVPPVVWLLRGSLEHLWNSGGDFRFPMEWLEEEEREDNAKGLPWEVATVTRVGCCAGPFNTVRAFLASTIHPGILRASEECTVVILTREKFDALDAVSQKALLRYLLDSQPQMKVLSH